MRDAPTPEWLKPGDLVGPWRIEGYGGRGSFGAVYRARRAGHPGSAPVALKVALFADDPRFAREVELLSRMHHPSLPQLLDRGTWHSGLDTVHPYLVMEWIRGKPLYDWAREHNPTSRQVLKVVAQVAWALEVLHRANALHRDVRGGNIMVEPEGRAVLVDFGSCTWAGAPPLTQSVMPPNTREYRSPEALRFHWENVRRRGAHYEARPADDLYALGVSAYQLVTGVYPPPGTDLEARRAPLRRPPPLRLLPQALNGRVTPELAALIERLLAQEPEMRGPPREVAEAAESAALHSGPEADVPLFDSEKPGFEASPQAEPLPVAPVAASVRSAVEVAAVPDQVHAEALGSSWHPGRVLFATTLLLSVVGTCWMAPESQEAPTEFAQAEAPDAGVAPPDAGTAGLGDATSTARVDTQEVPSSVRAISLEMPKKPLPGQRLSPCRRGEVEINGGCWVGLLTLTPPCGDEAYEWNGICYMALYVDRRRVPTTDRPQQ